MALESPEENFRRIVSIGCHHVGQTILLYCKLLSSNLPVQQILEIIIDVIRNGRGSFLLIK